MASLGMCLIQIGTLISTMLCLKYAGAVCESTTTTSSGSFISAEKKLLTCLQEDYDPIVRPANDPNKTILVTVDSYMATIFELDEKTNVLTTDLWLYQSWRDEQLSWKPEEFSGITEIHVPIDRIWTPEIVLHNNVDDNFGYTMGKLASVTYEGNVTWIPHGKLKSRCQLDLTRFPFDSQTCVLWIGPWAYDKKLVDVQLPDQANEYREFLQKTVEWEVDGYMGHKRDLHYGNKTFSAVIFQIRMTRTSTFFRYMLIGPSVVLAILTLSLFWIPVNSGERFMLASGILVSLVVLLDVLEGYLPTDIGRLPSVAQYIGFNMGLITMAIIISVLVFNFYHRGVKRSPVPTWMRRLLLGQLSKLLFITSIHYAPVPLVSATTRGEGKGFEREMRSTLRVNYEDNPRRDDDSDAASLPGRVSGQQLALEKTLDDIRRYLQLLATKSDVREPQIELPSHHQLVVSEWHQVALVIDRASFWLLLFITVVCTMAMYLK